MQTDAAFDTAYAMLTLVHWPAFTVKEASTAFTVLILLFLQCNCYAMLTLVSMFCIATPIDLRGLLQ